MEQDDCKTCKGSGYQHDFSIVPECDGDDVIDCHDCDGKGMVIINIEIPDDPFFEDDDEEWEDIYPAHHSE